ncbi:MAG: ATP-dependent DNA helicase [Betaproteobacteria bacterium]
MTVPTLEQVFAPDGLLSRSIPAYRQRPQQMEMAHCIADAIRDNSVLVAEAGTGTGKTVSYLVPALLSGGKVIISTGTKTLQDQLYSRDLPTVRAALGVPVTTALLKGRANYVCHYHLAHNLKEARLPTREAARDLRLIEHFARATQSGDRGELAEVAEDSPAWAYATSTRENCLGQSCPNHKECFVLAARREALEAEVVVVNHHLFFADVVLRDEGMAELLPACNTVIFDEAHQLPDTATLFFGETVSTGQVLDLCRDSLVEALSVARDVSVLPELIRRTEKAGRDLRLALPESNTRLPYKGIVDRDGFELALKGMIAALQSLAATLESQAQRGEGLENCWQRAAELAARLTRWLRHDEGDMVRWVEAYSQALALHATPLSIAEIFRNQLTGRPRAWVFTSATLAVNGNFDHYCAQLGLESAATGCWGSPFDYANNALLYLPPGLPEPNSREHTEAVVSAAMPLLRASRGRAFMLFTTLRGMRLAHELLRSRFAAEGLDYPLLLQGEGSRTELLARFRRMGNAVLVGSASFWEGVDVRGEALSLVVIDKLPFAPPDDPVLAARLEAMTKQGRNAFMEYQLPYAAIALKQGAGRLIRDETDRGVLAICDPRLATKAYGRTILASLPPMRRSRSEAEAVEFLESIVACVD